MFYLLWGLLNIALFIFFIVLCFKATKLVRERLGLASAIVFVFGLLAFVGARNDDNENSEPTTNIPAMWKHIRNDTLQHYEVGVVDLILEKNLVVNYNFLIHYRKTETGDVPVLTNSTSEGLVSGTKWTPVIITVDPTSKRNQFVYEVIGRVDWNLLGLKVYSQFKTFKGVAHGQ